MVEIGKNDLLGDELVMRGGTCLHKLHLAEPLRYSEDLDYVRRTRSGIGQYLDALRALAIHIGLVEHQRARTGQMVHMIFDTEATDGLRRIRIKIETNGRETESCFETVRRPFRVSSSWWSGEAQISTFELDELMGTKLRALYQRRKGRDLFDLWHVLTEADVHDDRIMQAFNHYMGSGAFTYPQLRANLADKLADPDFAADLSELLTTAPAHYELASAADIVMERLGSRLANAPELNEIRGGRWRAKANRT